MFQEKVNYLIGKPKISALSKVCLKIGKTMYRLPKYISQVSIG
jgi:hypothetical protein